MLEIRHLTKRFNGIPVVEDVIQHPARRDPGLCRSQRRRIDPGLRPCPADGFGGWGFSAAQPVRIGRHTAGAGPVGGAGQPYSCAAGYQDRPACRVAR